MAYYLNELYDFKPCCPQEEQDKALICACAAAFGQKLLTRDCLPAHITASGFVVDEKLRKVLMVFHHIYGCWSWTGGHADGESDLMAVAAREVAEETGIKSLTPLSRQPVSMEVLTVEGHTRRGLYVPDHLHLNFTYLFMASSMDTPRPCPEENSGAAWLEKDKLWDYCSREPKMVRLYQKLLGYAEELC